jgi:bifunctional DNA-binding transcriptional regulator/antitoxin component of YhaV-PrlF toxin-antitoxin module
MQTKINADENAMFPKLIMRELGLRPGDVLKVAVEGGSIILPTKKTPAGCRRYQEDYVAKVRKRALGFR